MILNENKKLILPKGANKVNLIPKGATETKKYLDTIPDPVGYRILVRPWTGSNKTKGGVYLTRNDYCRWTCSQNGGAMLQG